MTFYLADGLTKLAEYAVAPGQSPYTLTFEAGYPLWFDDGLKVMTGNCVVNLIIVY